MPNEYTHYKTLCISMYLEDASRLDQMVNELVRRGQTHANRSALIRYALSKLSVDSVLLPLPRGKDRVRQGGK